MKRVSLIFVSLFLIQNCRAQSGPPNIIYILADDLGIGDISCYNPDSKIQTPYIDAIADQGMMFTDAHTSSSVCTPTRYGILTGRYNWRSPLKQGVLTGKSPALIPKSRKTVASMLQAEGYHTAFIGKWHLGWNWGAKDEDLGEGAGWDPTDFNEIDFSKEVTHTPNDLGFDYAYGHSGSLDMAPYVYVENGHATALPDTVTVNTGKYSWWREGPTASDFEHEDVTPNFFRRAMKYIQSQGKDRQPYFLYLALPSPHTPILPGKKWQGKSGLNPYADFMLMIDSYIGELVGSVRATDASDNTIIIFTSDNGVSPASKLEELEEKGHFSSSIYRGHKADIFEGGHRVPFIVSWPAVVESASTSQDLICTTDLMATVAEVIDHQLIDNEGEDSFSFLHALQQKNNQDFARKSIIHHSINGSFAFRKDKWKLILCPGSGGWSHPTPRDTIALKDLPPYQLYNLEQDPSERENQYANDPEKVKEMKNEFFSIIESGRSTPGIRQENETGFKGWPQLEKLLND